MDTFPRLANILSHTMRPRLTQKQRAALSRLQAKHTSVRLAARKVGCSASRAALPASSPQCSNTRRWAGAVLRYRTRFPKASPADVARNMRCHAPRPSMRHVSRLCAASTVVGLTCRTRAYLMGTLGHRKGVLDRRVSSINGSYWAQ